MPLINLIHEQRYAARQAEKQLRISIFAWLGITVVSTAAWMTFTIGGAQANSQIAQIEVDATRLHSTQNQVESNEKLLTEFRPRLNTLKEAQTTSNRWIRLLRHFQTQTPDKTWLVGLKSAQADVAHPVSMSIVGVSLSQAPVADLMLRLQNQPDLDNVALRFTQPKLGPTGEQVDFELGADIQGTAQPVPVATPEVKP